MVENSQIAVGVNYKEKSVSGYVKFTDVSAN